MSMNHDLAGLIAALSLRGVEEIQRETRFDRDLKVDTLGFLEIILAAESHYRCYLEDESLALVVTVGDLEDLLIEKVGSDGAKSGEIL